MDDSILILTTDFDSDEFRGAEDILYKVSNVPVNILKNNIDQFLTSFSKLITDLNIGTESYILNEITIKLAVGLSGEISLFGSGLNTSGTSGIEIKFVRKP